MQKAIGILLLFAGAMGGYLVLTGKFPPGGGSSTPATPTTPGGVTLDSKGNPITEKNFNSGGNTTGHTQGQQTPAQSGDRTGSGGESWQSAVMGIPMLLTHTGDMAAGAGGF